jgi:flagellar basal-body rod protein FlgB
MTVDGVDPTVQALRTVLARASRRAQVVASNLANVDTPGYRALDVVFPETSSGELRLDLERSSPIHLNPPLDEPVHGKLIEAPASRIRKDGNSVDVDREMTRLALSSGRYRTAVEMLRKRFALLVYTATDGRPR